MIGTLLGRGLAPTLALVWLVTALQSESGSALATESGLTLTLE